MILNTQGVSIEPPKNQRDMKELKDRVKRELNNKVVAGILFYIGVEVTKDFKFVQDKSFSIAKNGKIRDWGATDFQGDIFDFLIQEKSITLPVAIKYVADCLGIDYE